MTDIAPALVPATEVDAMWPHVAPLLAPALARGADFSMDDAHSRATRGFWQLWICAAPGQVAGAALSSLEEYPQRRVLHIHAAGGMAKMVIPELWPLLARFAADSGCKGVRFLGRRGWLRSGFIPAGWRHVADVVELEV